jgi:hypothetical protein
VKVRVQVAGEVPHAARARGTRATGVDLELAGTVFAM